MQQFKEQSIWKQFKTMDCLQQALCHTIWLNLLVAGPLSNHDKNFADIVDIANINTAVLLKRHSVKWIPRIHGCLYKKF